MAQEMMAKPKPQDALVAAFKTDMASIRSYLTTLLPGKGAVERFEQMAHLARIRIPRLMEADRTSFLLALIWCAQKDLEPGVDDGCWLIPFKVKGVLKVTPIPAYKGLIKKAEESGSVKKVEAHGVFSKDEFSYTLGTDPVMHHRPPPLGQDRGELIGAYVVFTFSDGDQRFEVMDRAEIEKVRNAGAAWRTNPGEGPWADWEDQQFNKTVIKRGFKQIPVKSAFRDLISDDSRMEGGEALSQLVQEGAGLEELPVLLVDEPEPEPEKKADTSQFDLLLKEKMLPAERVERMMVFLDETAKRQPGKKKTTREAMMERAGSNFATFYEAFETFEAKRYPAPPKGEPAKGEPEPEQEPPPEEPENEPDTSWGPEPAGQGPVPGKAPVTADLQARVSKAWDGVVEKGIGVKDLAKIGINNVGNINQDNIGLLEALVQGYVPKKK